MGEDHANIDCSLLIAFLSLTWAEMPLTRLIAPIMGTNDIHEPHPVLNDIHDLSGQCLGPCLSVAC